MPSSTYPSKPNPPPPLTKPAGPAQHGVPAGPAQHEDELVIHETVGDEQRARSAEMEAAGGPEAWMKATASPPPETEPPPVVEGVSKSPKK